MVVLFATDVVETEEEFLLDVFIPRADKDDDDDDDDDWDLDADEDVDELEELGDMEDWGKVKDPEENGGW